MGKRGTSGRYTPPSSRRYTPEFKRDAVALLQSSGRSIAAVARELGVSDVTLAAWVREQEKASGAADAAATEADRQEAVQLRKRIKELEQEIEILKRFTAYWVKEGGQ
jgi:transposase